MAIYSFNSLASHMTDRTANWEVIRRDFDSRYWLVDASINKSNNLLDVRYLVAPTYKTGEPVTGTSNGPKSTKNRYSILFRVYKLEKLIKDYAAFSQLSLKEQTKIIWKALNLLPVRIYSDDPSFLYQGMWVDCEMYNMALFKLKPEIAAKDKGIWRARDNSDTFRVTKHIGQLSLASKSSINTVAYAIASHLQKNPDQYYEHNETKAINRLLENIKKLENNQMKRLTEEEQKAVALKDLISQVAQESEELLNLEIPEEDKAEFKQDLKSLISKTTIDSSLNGTHPLLDFTKDTSFKMIQDLGFEPLAKEWVETFSSLGHDVWKAACIMLTYSHKLSFDTSYNFVASKLFDEFVTKSDTKTLKYSVDMLPNYKARLQAFLRTLTTKEIKAPQITLDTKSINQVIFGSFGIADAVKGRNSIGRGELPLALILGSHKPTVGGGDVALANTANSKIPPLEVKYGSGKLDGGDSKSNTLSVAALNSAYEFTCEHLHLKHAEKGYNSLSTKTYTQNEKAKNITYSKEEQTIIDLTKEKLKQKLEDEKLDTPDLGDSEYLDNASIDDFDSIDLDSIDYDSDEGIPDDDSDQDVSLPNEKLQSHIQSIKDVYKHLKKLNEVNLPEEGKEQPTTLIGSAKVLDLGVTSIENDWTETNIMLAQSGLGQTERETFFRVYLGNIYYLRFSTMDLNAKIKSRFSYIAYLASRLGLNERYLNIEGSGLKNKAEYLQKSLATRNKEEEKKQAKDILARLVDIDFCVYAFGNFKGQEKDNHSGLMLLRLINDNSFGMSNDLYFMALGLKETGDIDVTKDTNLAKRVKSNNVNVTKIGRDSRQSNFGIGINKKNTEVKG